MSLPDFLVIGAGRSGTTSLHHYLHQHPDVFLPGVKSPSYFYCLDESPETAARRHRETRSVFVRSRSAYEALFEGSEHYQAVGEVSPAYLASTRVAARIAAELPDVRLVAILRNPIERFHSRFVARRRDGLEPAPDLESLLAAEKKLPLRPADAAGTYLAAGYVDRVLETYFLRFPLERILLLLHDDLRDDASSTIRRLFEFLGVDAGVQIETTAHNRSGGTIPNATLRFLWTRSAPLRLALRGVLPKAARDAVFHRVTRSLERQPIPESVHAELARHYREEVERLGRRTGRDLSHWLQFQEPGTASMRREERL